MDRSPMLCMLLLVMTSSYEAVTVVDMTFTLGADTVYWPGSPPFNMTILTRGNQSGGYWYESNTFLTPEHGGTHVDAPAHFYEGGWRTEEIPASHLVGPAVVVDVKTKVQADPDYLLTVDDIKKWESMYGRLPDKAVVIMNSGWGSRYPNTSRVFNTNTPTIPATFHFPGIHPNTATFLTTQRDVIAVGVDTPSTDLGQSTTFDTHVILGRYNVIGLENLANVDKLPARGATLVVGVVKLRGGSGGPARILGIVADGDQDPFGNGTGSASSLGVQVWIYGIAIVYCMILLN